MEDDLEGKIRAQGRARASVPDEEVVSAVEPIRLDERSADTPRKRKKKKKSSSSEGSRSSSNTRRVVTRVSEAKPGAYAQTTDLEDAIAHKSRGSSAQAVQPGAQAQMSNPDDRYTSKVRAEAPSRPSTSKPGASYTEQLGELEAKIAAKNLGCETRRSTSKPGVSTQLDDLEYRIAAKSRRESRGTRSPVRGSKTQLDDLEEKIASKTRRASRGSSISTATAQLDNLEDKIAAKARSESIGTRPSTTNPAVAKMQLENLERGITAKIGRSRTSHQDPIVQAKQEAALPHGIANPEQNIVIPDYMDSFADYSNFKFDDDPDKITPEQQPVTTADHGIIGEPGVAYGQYPGGFDDDLAVAVAVDDDEDDAFIPAAIEYDPDAKPPIYKNRRFRLYGMLSCVLVTLVAIAVSVGVTSNKSNNDPTSPTTSFRETIGIQEQLVSVVGAEKLNDSKSPYAKAADWIMNDDPLQLLPESPSLIQRYLLAMFYFASSINGPWASCNRPEEGKNSFCVYKELLEVEPEVTYGSKEWIRWLSGENECKWAGVFCDENSNVAALELAGQNMTGTLPAEIGELVYLQSLTLDWNNFDGTLPASWAASKYLLNIEIHYNFLTGTIPNEWFSAKALQRINLGGNMLTGTVPTEIGNLAALKGFFNMENFMSGTIPNEFAGLKFVSYTRWSRNQHSGTIPAVFGNMDKLQECWLHSNKLTGKIPSEFGAMKDILDLRLQFNPLTGTIPEEIYNMATVTRLDLYDCQLSGTISTSISKLINLEVFRIRANRKITGTVPSELGQLSNIKEIWLHLTGLVGVMPDEVCKIRGPGNLEVLEANCAATDGFEPPALDCQGCCTECCDASSEVCAEVGEA